MQLYGIVLELVGVGFPNPSDAGPSPFAGGETPPLRLELKGEYDGQKLLRQSIWHTETER